MNGKILVSWLAALLIPGALVPARGAEANPVPAAGSASKAVATVDVRPKPLAQIPVGTIIGAGEEAPKGWTNLVMLAKPRLGIGDVDSVSKTAAQYSGTFLFTVLANVAETANGTDAPSFFLEKVAVGGALEGGGKTIVATSDQTFGNELGFLGKKVFAKGERVLANDFRQVARTRTMLVFDAHAYVRYDGKHCRMVIRHVILVAPQTGRLTTFVWLLGSNGKGGYARAETTLQLLPTSLREDRVMSVDGQKFTFGIPSDDAFAVARIPQGTPIRFSPPLSTLASVRHFNAESVAKLETELQTRYAPLAVRARADLSRTAGR
ncbi:hypothetical protein SAMN05444166_0474 [Singulisphaera sp. GP187]|uniref:hypothetical protein n=1 Tax=Singulisphaera sp. GP187 TaxID=1882752 RepID=UPI00092892EE|nr:hypothetical protein [Singulisphaera sp. GP187]SIN72799.1 hypothetical protein SAMN05444166_0474 [Singulisphaera sp. GP187]